MSTTSPRPSPGGSATETALPALTTPFVQEPACASIWSLSSIESPDHGKTATVNLLVPDIENERFSSCQPSGWDSVVPESRFHFSPAVCPSHWTYYNISETTSYDYDSGAVGTYTTALCCASGFQAPNLGTDFTIPSIPTACHRSVDSTLFADSTTTAHITDGLVQIHPAWVITWHASDTSTLTPVPPTLTSNNMLIPTWVPSQKGPEVEYTRLSDDDDDYSGSGHVSGRPVLIWLLVVGFPVLGLLGLTVWCLVAVPRRKEAKRVKEEEDRERERRARMGEGVSLGRYA
ncbi:hypothetical protein FQN54_006581 [Arachnomyces sp. PD_36]|nr:hypothetical protein FQN54_006581 [Arachnomyces sp. PD_36]